MQVGERRSAMAVHLRARVETDRNEQVAVRGRVREAVPPQAEVELSLEELDRLAGEYGYYITNFD
jgi:hypothetical protein